MKITFDPLKNEKNIRERGLSFEQVTDFDFDSALYFLDERCEYGEVRQVAVGYLQGRLHVLCFLERTDGMRVISFRKANAREGKKYGKALTLNQ